MENFKGVIQTSPKKPINKDNFIVKLLKGIRAFFLLYVVFPIKQRIDEKKAEKARIQLEKEKAQSIKDLKKSFEKTFNTDIESMKKVMGAQKQKQTDKDYLTNEIVKARKYISENGITTGGQMTDPTAMNEHNENGGYTTNTLSEVIRKDKEFSDKVLNRRDTRELADKAKVRWITRA